MLIKTSSCSGRISFALIVALVIVVVGGWYGWSRYHPNSGVSASAGQRPGPRGFRPNPNATQPVYAGVSKLADVPVYLNSLGTVVANASVTVIPRVSGELLDVYFKEGQYVEKGRLLAQIDDRSYQATLAQYQGALAQHKALLHNAQLTLTRYQRLYKEDSLAKQDLEQQIATVGEYQGEIKTDQAQIDAAKLNINYAQIKAPISGYTGLRQVDPGNLVSADSTTLVTITQVQPIAVTFSIPQANLQSVLQTLRSGGTFAVTVFNQTNTKALASGRVKYISNSIDTSTGTVKLKAQFANPNERLYPNQFVNVRLQVEQLDKAVIVPKAALQLSDSGDYLFVIHANQKVSKVSVTAGPDYGQDYVVISKGIKAGEKVVTTGVDNLSDGSKVKILSGKAQ